MLPYREQVSSSEVVQVSTEGVEQLETYFGKYLPQLFYSLIAPVTLFVILCRVSLKASVVLLICVPLIPISIVVVQKIARKLLNKYWSIYTGLGDSFLENLQGSDYLKDLSGRPAESRRDGCGVPAVPPDHHEGFNHAAEFHQCDGYCGLRRCGHWYGGGGDGVSTWEFKPFRNPLHCASVQ